MFLKPPKRSRMEIRYRNSNCFKNIFNTLWNQCMTKCITSFAKDLVTATWRVQKMLLTYNKLLREEKGTDFDQSLTSEFVKLWQYFKNSKEKTTTSKFKILKLEGKTTTSILNLEGKTTTSKFKIWNWKEKPLPPN